MTRPRTERDVGAIRYIAGRKIKWTDISKKNACYNFAHQETDKSNCGIMDSIGKVNLDNIDCYAINGQTAEQMSAPMVEVEEYIRRHQESR
jgi:hypothetical protein